MALMRGTLSRASTAYWRLQPAEGAQAGCDCQCGITPMKWGWPLSGPRIVLVGFSAVAAGVACPDA